MNNPSPISITVGDVTLRVWYQGYDIGPAIIKNLVAVPGANTYDADFQLTPTADTNQQVVLASVLSGYLMQQTFQFEVKGNTDSTSVDSLKEGFAGLDLKTTLTGIPATLINKAQVWNLVVCSDGLNPCASTTFTIQNNIDTGFSIIGVQAEVWYTPKDPTIPGPVQIATINDAFKSPFFIGARQLATSPPLTMVINGNMPFQVLLEVLGYYGSADPIMMVNVVQKATITVGNDGSFHGALAYQQNGVPVDMSTLATPYPAMASLFGSASAHNSSASLPLSTASIPLSTPSVPITTSSPVSQSSGSTVSSTDSTTTTTSDSTTTTTTVAPTTPTTAPVTTGSPSGASSSGA